MVSFEKPGVRQFMCREEVVGLQQGTISLMKVCTICHNKLLMNLLGSIERGEGRMIVTALVAEF